MEADAPTDRELVLVEGLRDYLAEIEHTQAALLRIAREALVVAITELEKGAPKSSVSPP